MARGGAQPSGDTILIVDDQAETLRSTQRLLEREGHRVLLATDGEEALALLRHQRPQLLIVDYFMPGMTGEELIGRIRREDENIQILLQTGYAGEKPAREMLRALDIQGYHDKSEGAVRLLLWVDVCLKAHRQLQRVREAERLKGEMLANLSHEFRTPLNISLGYLGMLTDGECGELNPRAHELLAGVRRNTTSLLGLIDDLLDLAKLETQAAELRLEPVVLVSCRREIVQAFEGLAGERPLRLIWNVPARLPAVRVDRAKLRLILEQLLSYAAAAVAAGEVHLHAAPVGATQAAVYVRLPGPPIPLEERDALFEPLLQSRTGGEAGRGVAGVGLAVARRLARGMGGDVTFDTDEDGGARVAVVLPLAASDLAAPTDGSVPS